MPLQVPLSKLALQTTGSQHTPLLPWVQMPSPLQPSMVQEKPSSHAPPTSPGTQHSGVALVVQTSAYSSQVPVKQVPPGQTRGVPLLHVPSPSQLSPIVQNWPSSHALPLSAGARPQVFLLSLHLPIMHPDSEPQGKGWPTHSPLPSQSSETVQKKPSSHTTPLSLGWLLQVWELLPVETHTLSTHGLPSTAGQTTGAPPLHLPPAQVSLSLQPLPSSQLVPAGLAMAWQLPVAASQMPALHTSATPLQSTGAFPAMHELFLQLPLPGFWHLSAGLQLLPSAGVSTHLPPVQVSVVHGFLSSHSLSTLQSHFTVDTHLPPLHASVVQTLPSSHVAPSSGVCTQSALRSQLSVVHAFLSSHGAELARCWQLPVLGSQLSKVHNFPSSHGILLPWHPPFWHASLAVHGLPSSHAPLPELWKQPTSAAQASMVHGLLSAQSAALPARQLPDIQKEVAVQASLSSQAGVPGVGKVTHWPVPTSHAVFRHTPSLLVSQITAEFVLGTQTFTPESQKNLAAQRLVALATQSPSVSQGHALLEGLPLHAPFSHRSFSEHGLPSSQLPTSKPTTVQPADKSQASLVHGLPSLHTSSLGVCSQPVLLAQVSIVQSMPSLHTMGDPWHCPLTHASPWVHKSLSSHVTPRLVTSSWTIFLP